MPGLGNMWMILLLLGYEAAVVTEVSAWMVDCGIRDWDACEARCPPRHALRCPYGTYHAVYACDCCHRCRKAPGEPCGGTIGRDTYHGDCADGYTCYYKMTPQERIKWVLFDMHTAPGRCKPHAHAPRNT